MFIGQIKTKITRQLAPHIILSVLLYSLATYSCAQSWEALNPLLNLFNGTINTTTVDASGHIYAGGDFKNGSGNNFVATWNGTNWTEVGAGNSRLNANGTILTLASYRDTVYAAGAFANRLSQYYIAKWNGSSWSELDSNSSLHANGFIYSLAVDKAGNVYAAGSFTDTAGKYYVAKWNGMSWSKLGTDTNPLNANSVIYSVAVDASGNVYAAGYFTNAVGKKYVAKWNGTTWSELGTGTNALNANDYIRCLATGASGNVYAGGSFRNSSGECYLAKWNGSSWTETGTGTGALHANSTINTVLLKNETEIYVAGIFTDWGGSSYVAKWNGNSWSQVTNPQEPLQTNNRVESISVDAAGNIYAGGKFLNKSGHSYVAKWNGTDWNELGATGDPFYTSQSINQLIGDSVGNVYAAVDSHDIGDRYYLQHWNGKTWKQLSIPDSAGLSLFLNGSHPMVLDKKGTLYVPGRRTAGTNNYDCVVTWDGARWGILEDFPNSLGTYNSNPVYGLSEIETDPQGNIYVAGGFSDPVFGICSLAKWNGKTWTRLPGSTGYIQNFCVTGDGNIYAFGDFTDEFGRAVIANYNPAKHNNWAEVKSGSSRFGVPGFNVFSAIATDDKNNLYVNGNFTNTAGNRYIAKWDGNTWSELGATSSLGLNLAIDRNNNVYTNKASSSYGDPIKKWNGTGWIGIGVPLTMSGLDFTASLLTIDAAGNVYSNAHSPRPGVGSYIVRFGTVSSAPPKLSSFTPTSGSVGTIVTISGKNLSGTTSVRFGGTNASSFTMKNDSTIAAVVANGSSGSVTVKTAAGEDSLQRFTYTCDSVKAPVPTISLVSDSILLVTSQANYYQWYFNNTKLPNAVSNSVITKNAGFYHVEASADRTCWVPSLDYPVLIGRGATSDSLQLLIYPNPSTGNSTAYIKLPQVATVLAYVQVFDMIGGLVFQTSKLIFYGNEIRIPIIITTKGTFFVKMTVNNKTFQQSVIIM